jgi:hypothetical protein
MGKEVFWKAYKNTCPPDILIEIGQDNDPYY